MDWMSGTWRTEGEPPDKTIAILGDWAPIGRLERVVLDAPGTLHGDVGPLLRAADLRIVNLEGVLTRDGRPVPKDGPNMAVRPEALLELADVPIEAACLANNHVMDFGPDGLRETRERLEAKGIRAVGAGATRSEALEPLVLAVGDATIGIVNFCEGEDETAAVEGPGVFGWEIDTVLETVRRLRDRADVVLAIAHAGFEYAPAPPPYVREVYRAVAAAGADAVVGHHPHVPQGVEVLDGVPIVYSLGNSAFRPRTGKWWARVGLLLTLELHGPRLTGLRLTPFSIRKTGLALLEPGVRAACFERLRVASEFLADEDLLREAWEAFVDARGERFWRRRAGGLADLAKLVRKDPRAGAAKLRNRLRTPAHAAYLSTGFGRLVEGTMGTAPAEARALVDEWRRSGPPG